MRIRIILAVAVMLASGVESFAGWEEGVFAFQTEDYVTAEAEFRVLVQQDPNGYRGHYMLGLTLQQVGRSEEARQHLRKAYGLNPSDLKVKTALARSYYDAGQYDKIGALLGSIEAALLPPQSQSAVLQLRGMTREKTGDTEGALQDFLQLAAIEPDNAAVQYFYGAKAVAAGHLDAGIPALERAMELDPQDSAKARMYALALIKRGRVVGDDAAMRQDYLRAAAVAAKMAEADPTHANLMLRSSAELGAGEYAKAVETSKAAIAANPGDWLAHYYLGQAYSGSQQYAAAEQPLRASLERAGPEDQRLVWRQLGWIYEKQSKPAEAAEAYRHAEAQSGTVATPDKVKADPADSEIEARKHRLMETKREAEQIEQELKKLEARPN